MAAAGQCWPVLPAPKVLVAADYIFGACSSGVFGRSDCDMLETPQNIRSYSFNNVQHKVALLIILGGRDPVKEAPRFL